VNRGSRREWMETLVSRLRFPVSRYTVCSDEAGETVSRLNTRGTAGYYSYRRIFDLQLTRWARSLVLSRLRSPSYRPPLRLLPEIWFCYVAHDRKRERERERERGRSRQVSPMKQIGSVRTRRKAQRSFFNKFFDNIQATILDLRDQ